MKIFLLAIFGLFSLATCLPTTDDNYLTEDGQLLCDEVFSKHDMNFSTFHIAAGHGLHSLSLEEIRYFFKKDAPEDNKIPTVNIDFRAKDIINFNAPLWGYSDRFDTWALKVMDWFMLNDQPYLYNHGMTTLEKITHQYHMQEIYQRAAKVYRELEKNPPSENFCSCATDFTVNGIPEVMIKTARTLKYFGTVKQHDNMRKGKMILGFPGDKFGAHYDARFYEQARKKRSTPEDVSELLQEYLKNPGRENAKSIFNSDAVWMPGTLTEPDHDKWIPYKAMLTYSNPDPNDDRDFASFMYCMLN